MSTKLTPINRIQYCLSASHLNKSNTVTNNGNSNENIDLGRERKRAKANKKSAEYLNLTNKLTMTYRFGTQLKRIEYSGALSCNAFTLFVPNGAEKAAIVFWLFVSLTSVYQFQIDLLACLLGIRKAEAIHNISPSLIHMHSKRKTEKQKETQLVNIQEILILFEKSFDMKPRCLSENDAYSKMQISEE